MSLKDFDKIDNSVKKNSSKRDVVEIENNIDMKSIFYFLFNIDELLELVNGSYCDYINAKLTYDFKKDKLQTTTNWNEENALRESNNLPKVTNQDQRDAVIDLKLKDMYVDVKSLEMRYKWYNKIFNFIDKNFDLLYSNLPDDVEIDVGEKICTCKD